MTHQAKRPYAGSQPSITSYFSPSSTSNYSISSHEPRIPTALPPSVQSNLLGVGMRVRKSVPEGYKTGTYSTFQLFSDFDPKPTMMKEASITPLPKTRPRAGARELTPFCGILKVGGLAQQAWGGYESETYSFSTSAVEDDYDDVPFLSQSSMSTDASFDTPNGNKRRFSEDEEEVITNRFGTGDTALSERVMAVPKRKKVSGKASAVRIIGQENIGFNGEDVDFEDADFLDYSSADEVEMSG